MNRITQIGEIFTPSKLVDEIVNKLYQTNQELFLDPTKTFLEPASGDGEFLIGIIRKLQQVRRSFTLEDWYHTITKQLYGVDLMWDNTCDTMYYLLRSYDDLDSDPQVETGLKQGYVITDQSTPEQINEGFEARMYTDDWGTIIMCPQAGSKHNIEYQIVGTDQWVQVDNIVRANSLTEWDFENWRPK
jgi:hypothetical protein